MCLFSPSSYELGSSRLTQQQQQPLLADKMEEERETLFLIDFEAVEDGDKMRLKPQSRKYGMSTLFDTHLAQNWFFRQAGRSLLVRILILNAKNKYVGWVDFVLHRNEYRFLPVFRPC